MNLLRKCSPRTTTKPISYYYLKVAYESHPLETFRNEHKYGSPKHHADFPENLAFPEERGPGHSSFSLSVMGLTGPLGRIGGRDSFTSDAGPEFCTTATTIRTPRALVAVRTWWADMTQAVQDYPAQSWSSGCASRALRNVTHKPLGHDMSSS
eukprot:scaffold250852_cov37-Prasinocladus_malaysianus.AAC.2